MSVRVGLTGTHRLDVETKHTGVSNGFPGLPVLSNPWLTLACEMACHDAICREFEPGMSSVGSHLDLYHRAPVAAGATLTVHARLLEIDRRRLHFSVLGNEGDRVVVQGTHDRFLVDLERFLAHLS
jgi:predicted thioesterase